MSMDSGQRGAVFFDRDGVLNEDTGYVHRISDFRWIEGARNALRLVQEAGLLSIVVTNQSGVGRGYFSVRDVDLLHQWMRHDLGNDGIAISDFFICPFHEEAILPQYKEISHPDRKPNPGMIIKAMSKWALDPSKCLLIGDKKSDVEAGRRAGIKAVLYAGGDLECFISPHLKEILSS